MTAQATPPEARRLEFTDGVLVLTPLADGRRRAEVRLHDAQRYCATPVCETRYSDELLMAVVRTKGLAWMGDEILRDEEPSRVERTLRNALFRYVPEDALDGRRVLDFGSGSGASTMILSRLFPSAELVGVELDPALLRLAEARLRFYRSHRVRFELATQADALSPTLGTFDAIILNAVYEHMRPDERRALLPILWSALNPGGLLLLCETPYRWAAFDYHTTGLPFVNFLPDALCRWVACRFSVRVGRRETWPDLLRMGIRGGDPGEVVRFLREAGAEPEVLTPSRLGYHSAIDTWVVPPEELVATWRGGAGPLCRRVLTLMDRVVRRLGRVPAGAAIAMALRKPGAG